MKIKGLKILFYVSAAINIITIALIFLCYRYRYPALYIKEFEVSDTYIIVMPFFITLLIFAASKAEEKMKASRMLYGTVIFTLILSLIFSVICSMIFLVIPPVCSRTDIAAEYRKTDGVFEPSDHTLNDFYPEQIPDAASQVQYYYERYSTFFSDTMEMEASWILPQEEYSSVKSDVLESLLFKNGTMTINDGWGSASNDKFPGGVSLFFEFNDTIGRVTYGAYIEKKY